MNFKKRVKKIKIWLDKHALFKYPLGIIFLILGMIQGFLPFLQGWVLVFLGLILLFENKFIFFILRFIKNPRKKKKIIKNLKEFGYKF